MVMKWLVPESSGRYVNRMTNEALHKGGPYDPMIVGQGLLSQCQAGLEETPTPVLLNEQGWWLC